MNILRVVSDKMYPYSNIEPIPKGQIEFSKIRFILSDDWDDRSIIVQFVQGETPLNRGLENGSCFVPSELQIGEVTVYLKGYSISGESLATVNGVTIPIVQGGVDGGEPSVPPGPDLYQLLLKELNESEANAKDYSNKAVEAAEKAANAAVRQPIVGGNGNWWTWDLEAGAYVDTGIYSGGDAPYIGDNGNWYVGQTDTGVPATGPAGPAGEPGPVGPSGPTGPQGPAGPALAVNNTAAVGQTVKITAVDENGQPTEWEAVDMAEQVQPDWNQNDSTAADYVKNRTHYEESTYAEYVLNMGVTFITGFSMAEAGETMDVKINGVESAETVKEAESSILGASYKYIGNTDIDSLFNGGTGWIVAEASGQAVGYANPDTTIIVEGIVVHKINDKFINFDGFVRTFDYHFKNPTLYKLLYNDDGGTCSLYTCNNFILPESNSKLFGFMSEVGFSNVGSTIEQSCFINGFTINADGSITLRNVVLGTNTSEMEELAAYYDYTLTTNPNA